MNITIYTVTDCEFSKQEKAYLQAKGLDFEEKNLETNREYLNEMLNISNNFAGTPVTQIVKDDGKTTVLKGFTKEEFDKELGFTSPVDSSSVEQQQAPGGAKLVQTAISSQPTPSDIPDKPSITTTAIDMPPIPNPTQPINVPMPSEMPPISPNKPDLSAIPDVKSDEKTPSIDMTPKVQPISTEPVMSEPTTPPPTMSNPTMTPKINNIPTTQPSPMPTMPKPAVPSMDLGDTMKNDTTPSQPNTGTATTTPSIDMSTNPTGSDSSQN
ncbi:hypothetical protein KC726_05555 [Candidatus Woesebacteria bacterium]|nr:hypothetical protein [Candidatus Woesebacteria bacterium]